MCENDYDLNDLEIKTGSSLVKKINDIGGEGTQYSNATPVFSNNTSMVWEQRKAFGGRMLLLILLIKGPLTAEEILKEVKVVAEKIRKVSGKHKNFCIVFLYTDSDFGFISLLQRMVEFNFLKEIEDCRFCIGKKGLDYLVENLSRID